GLLRGDPEPTAVAPERTYPTTWDTRIAPIAEWVADERDLEFEHPVEVVLQPEAEYLDQADGDPATADEEDQQEMDDFVAVLRALGLVEGEVDLEAAYGDLASAGTLAYYDSDAEKVFVRGDVLTPAVRVTLAHELTHVLQDQHFDLDRLSDPDFEEADGLRAMAEGDAGRIEDVYVAEVLTADEQTAYEAETEASVDGSETALEGVPPVLSAIFAAPYTLGPGFLTYREQVDGGQPWDAVLQDPPSQEELLDPSAWETDRSAVADVEVAAPDGAEVLDEDTFDPLTWYLLLASRGDPAAALRVVDGWGGDAYVAYRQDDRVCAAMAVAGDDTAALDGLETALSAWAEGDPTGTTTVERAGATVEVRVCDPGAAAAATGTVTEELLSVPYLRAELEGAVVESGATEDQARCTSRALFEVLTLEQLTATTLGPALQQQVTEAVMACR
ncbi:MAG TPA: hypothetical protein VGO60_09685, partial [Iamia sp.]|nr:hypothetical protein [Iamia sp.]